MLETIRIENYKSIEKLDLPLGRINVFIGENGAGKSNILEAIALAGAAQARKLDNEFLTSRGIRVSGPELMRSAFKEGKASEPIKVSTKLTGGSEFRYALTNDNQPYSTWQNSSTTTAVSDFEGFVKLFESIKDYIATVKDKTEGEKFFKEASEKITAAWVNAQVEASSSGGKTFNMTFTLETPDDFPAVDTGGMEDFIIYAPENSALRHFEREGQIEPLGINGEGLLKLLSAPALELSPGRRTDRVTVAECERTPRHRPPSFRDARRSA